MDRREFQDLLEARRWLNRAWSNEKEIAALRSLQQETHDRLVSMTAAPDRVMVSGTKEFHKIDRLVELEDKIREVIERESAAKSEILDMAARIQDGRFRAIIIHRYTRFLTWERIAVEMSYGYRQVMRLHRSALYAVADELQKMS